MLRGFSGWSGTNSVPARKRAARPAQTMVEATELSAHGGDGASAYNMGYWHAYGREGLPQDLSFAASWFNRSASLGDVDGLASIGKCYANGLGVRKNCRSASLCRRRWAASWRASSSAWHSSRGGTGSPRARAWRACGSAG